MDEAECPGMFSTWMWCRSRSRNAVAITTSPAPSSGKSLADHHRWPEDLRRRARAFRRERSLRRGEPIPMMRRPIGEPYAGDPHLGFGGRGGASLTYRL